MSDLSARLDLPLIQPSQAQKHVTHNEALQVLDGLVQAALEETGAETPPFEPVNGQLYALGANPAGDWADQAGKLALRAAGAWLFINPQEGWRAWDKAAEQFKVYDGAAWVQILPDLNSLDGVGVGTASDATNRLAVASEASLFTHDGAGHQLKINKASAGDTASLLFQSGFTGHAEMGLAGDMAFSVKVSDDGETWHNALKADAAAQEVEIDFQVVGNAVQQSATDDTSGRLLTVGAFGLGDFAPTVQDAGIADLNDLTTVGFWTLAGTLDNTPFGTSGNTGTCTVIRREFTAGPSVTQLANYQPSGEQQLWYRQGSGDPITWSDWVQIHHTGNIVGTVSQSGGTPTGAVIERGSNSNGEYVRFTDGTQICTRECAIDVTSTGPQSFNFAATFSDGSGGFADYDDISTSWSHQISVPNAALEYANIRSAGHVGVSFVIRLKSAGTSSDPASREEKMTAMAVGRWD